MLGVSASGMQQSDFSVAENDVEALAREYQDIAGYNRKDALEAARNTINCD